MAAKKSQVKKILGEKSVGIDTAFYCCDRRTFYSIKELRDALSDMSDDVFKYHVNDQKNDFYNWVLYVFQEGALASEIQNKKTQKDMKKAIDKFLK
jgi:hypothetical protein